MKKIDLYPLKFNEIYKDYIWGGRNFEKIGKKLPGKGIFAESWEVSDHNDDISIVKNGPLKGKGLKELIEIYGDKIAPVSKNRRFPILIKYIDANKRLSVQVHPDDDYAQLHESKNEPGKTECWYIMDCPSDAELIMGIKRGITKDEFKILIKENRIEEGLNRLPILKGDLIYIKTGTVHALLEGIIVCEIQENSDTTYRLYDWGRVGHDGKPRPLHIEKALDVINFPLKEDYEKYIRELVIHYDKTKTNLTHNLVRCRYFNIDLLKYQKDVNLTLEDTHFHTLNILNGRGIIKYKDGEIPVKRGETILVPRTVKNYTIKTDSIEILKTFL